MTEVEPVWIDERVTPTSVTTGSAVQIDLADVGVVVLDQAGHVVSTNSRARDLLCAETPTAIDDRVMEVQRLLAGAPTLSLAMDEISVEVPGLGSISVRSCAVGGVGGDGTVLLLRDGRSAAATTNLLQQAARHRTFTFLARDWAHDLKGMLHVIRINGALLGRLLQRESPMVDAAVTKCLDAIPREVERLDRSIELMFSGKPGEQALPVDLGALCERLKTLVTARAIRQRVEVVLERTGGSTEVVGFEDQLQNALMNVIVNALEAMPEQGRLVISSEGGLTGVTVRICDSGDGMPPQLSGTTWRPHLMNDRRQTGIGLHVTRAIVESHGGRIECASNVPRGTCIEITFPTAASTGRLGHGSRTHR
jgi:signal transduction histidine kinase